MSTILSPLPRQLWLQNGVITWTGTVDAGGTVTITYGATVEPNLGLIVNSAVIDAGGDTFTRTATVTVDGPICSLTKYGGNPVLVAGAVGSWDADTVWGPGRPQGGQRLQDVVQRH